MKDKIWKLGREDEKESDFSLRIFNALSLNCVSDLKHLKLISSVGVRFVPSAPEPGMS